MYQASELELFPYPFKEVVYRYSNNSTPLELSNCIDITLHYIVEIKLKRQLLQDHPKRCYQSLPHTMNGQWEILELVMEHLTTNYPASFTLDKNRNDWKFENKILQETHVFIVGDPTTLPCQPLDFIGRHVQEDLIFMMQRDGDLYLDVGQLCFPANWSLAFDLGMSFREIHTPIPGFKEEGLDSRILQFLLQLEAGNPWWRKSWSLMAGNRLDTTIETFDVWGQSRKAVTRESAGELVHLRVEVQKFFRLPCSGGILFMIHTHFLSLEKLASKPEWAEQVYQILSELPPQIVNYKGLSLFKDAVIHYLKEQLKGRGDS